MGDRPVIPTHSADALQRYQVCHCAASRTTVASASLVGEAARYGHLEHVQIFMRDWVEDIGAILQAGPHLDIEGELVGGDSVIPIFTAAGPLGCIKRGDRARGATAQISEEEQGRAGGHLGQDGGEGADVRGATQTKNEPPKNIAKSRWPHAVFVSAGKDYGGRN